MSNTAMAVVITVRFVLANRCLDLLTCVIQRHNIGLVDHQHHRLVALEDIANRGNNLIGKERSDVIEQAELSRHGKPTHLTALVS